MQFSVLTDFFFAVLRFLDDFPTVFRFLVDPNTAPPLARFSSCVGFAYRDAQQSLTSVVTATLKLIFRQTTFNPE